MGKLLGIQEIVILGQTVRTVTVGAASARVQLLEDFDANAPAAFLVRFPLACYALMGDETVVAVENACMRFEAEEVIKITVDAEDHNYLAVIAPSGGATGENVQAVLCSKVVAD